MQQTLTRRWLSWSLSPLQSSSGSCPPSRLIFRPDCCGPGSSEEYPQFCRSKTTSWQPQRCIWRAPVTSEDSDLHLRVISLFLHDVHDHAARGGAAFRSGVDGDRLLRRSRVLLTMDVHPIRIRNQTKLHEELSMSSSMCLKSLWAHAYSQIWWRNVTYFQDI